jgi:DNA-binding MarR family transcriptional regulator
MVDTSATLDEIGCYVNLKLIGLAKDMAIKQLSPQELRVWHAFRLMHEDVLARVDRDIAQATGLSGPEFGVLSRLDGPGKREVRQQVLARLLAWDKSRLSHLLTRMQERSLIDRRRVDGKTVLIVLTPLGKEKLDAARPVHAASVRRNLLSRLTQDQIDTMVRVTNLLGEEE